MDIEVKNVHRSEAYAGQGTARICVSMNSSITTSTFEQLTTSEKLRWKSLSVQLSSKEVEIILWTANPSEQSPTPCK